MKEIDTIRYILGVTPVAHIAEKKIDECLTKIDKAMEVLKVYEKYLTPEYIDITNESASFRFIGTDFDLTYYKKFDKEFAEFCKDLKILKEWKENER